MGSPPLPPEVKNNSALSAPATAEFRTGASGTVIGVTGTAMEGKLSPISLVAITEQEYSVPLVSPSTLIGEASPVLEKAPHFAV